MPTRLDSIVILAIFTISACLINEFRCCARTRAPVRLSPPPEYSSKEIYTGRFDPVSGFARFKFKDKIKNTLITGSERMGQGEVIYLTDNPYFRGFWKSGRIVLGNITLR
ncbi:MAG: hypothetical protein ACUVTX_00170 [Bacteroidales bacterium]